VDNLTHTLMGVTLVRAGLGRGAAGATATMILASNLPDADIVTLVDGSLAYFAWHRGPTHGPIGVVVLGCLAALLVVAWRGLRTSSRPGMWSNASTLTAVGVFGTALHVCMDLPTIYAVRLLSPFSDVWYSLDWVPIIDIYIWGLLIGGLIAAQVKRASRQRIARVVLACILVVYGVRGSAHQVALRTAETTRGHGEAAACASAPTLTRHPTLIEAASAGPGMCLQAAALPSFLSPLSWRLVRQQADGYDIRDYTIGRGTTAQVFLPSQHDTWVARARTSPTGRVFFGFSRFPAIRSAMLPDGTRRVRAMDVRFLGPPPRALEPDPQARAPFVMTVDVADDGTLRSERLGN
jgi:membrane-bound metal-dependent hydrolase YbcI (DUF457 family)